MLNYDFQALHVLFYIPPILSVLKWRLIWNLFLQSGAWDPRSKHEDPAQVHNRRYPSIFLKTSWGPGVKRGLKRGGGSYHFFQPALWVKSSSWPPQSHKKARRWASLPEPAIDMPQVLLERTDN